MASSIIQVHRDRLPSRAGIALALLLASTSALAEEKGSNVAAADALYREGRDLLKAGKHAEGCAKLTASLAIYPAASTMINIAKCHEQDGKLATAWTDYTRALDLNGDTAGAERRRGLEDLARQGMRALEPRLPRLRIVIKSPPPGVHVWSGDRELPAAALGEALPADPGAVQVRVSAPGYRDETRSATLEEGRTSAVEIELQKALDPSSGRPLRAPGVALVAVGAAGLVAGAVTGGLSLAKVGAIKTSCGGVHCPSNDTADQGALSSAKTLGTASTVALVAGGALSIAGVVLLVLPGGGPPQHGEAARVSVSLGLGRLDLRGSF